MNSLNLMYPKMYQDDTALALMAHKKKYRKTFNEKEFSPISAICEHNNISGHQ